MSARAGRSTSRGVSPSPRGSQSSLYDYNGRLINKPKTARKTPGTTKKGSASARGSGYGAAPASTTKRWGQSHNDDAATCHPPNFKFMFKISPQTLRLLGLMTAYDAANIFSLVPAKRALTARSMHDPGSYGPSHSNHGSAHSTPSGKAGRRRPEDHYFAGGDYGGGGGREEDYRGGGDGGGGRGRGDDLRGGGGRGDKEDYRGGGRGGGEGYQGGGGGRGGGGGDPGDDIDDLIGAAGGDMWRRTQLMDRDGGGGVGGRGGQRGGLRDLYDDYDGGGGGRGYHSSTLMASSEPFVTEPPNASLKEW